MGRHSVGKSLLGHLLQLGAQPLVGAVLLAFSVPNGMHLHGRHVKGQLVQRQFMGHAGGGHKVAWQHREQIGVHHHPPRREKLVHREHDAPLLPDGGQGLVHKAIGTTGKTDQQVPGRAIGLQADGPLGQRVALAHHAHVFARIQALVFKRNGFARLGACRQ
ncbi:MAG: hypothetical protein AN485_23930, partial [Anabaena sp. MDT14b]